MKLNDFFRLFVQNISLTASREARIESALTAWKNIFEGDDEIKDDFIFFSVQGSYATKTAIKPQCYC